MYQWFIINSTTGAVGTHQQSQSPMVESNEIKEFDLNLIPTGFTVVNIYDDTNPMPSTYQSVWDNPQAYLYQNGQFVNNPNWTTIQLAQARTQQEALIQAGLNVTLTNGFTSKSTGHTYVTTTNGQTNMEGELKRFELDSTLTSVQFYTIDKGWLSHTHQDLINAFLDGGKWKDAQYAQAQTLIGDIQTASTVSTVQSITWMSANY